MAPRLGNTAAAVLSGAVAAAAYRQLKATQDDPKWQRTNYRGAQLDLFGGPAAAAGLAAAGVVAGGGLAVPVAALGAAAVGHLDDVRGQRVEEASDKGLAGHLNALRNGRLSAGAIKVAGLIGIGVSAAWLNGRRGALDIGLDAACIAGSANLINLFDLRPGRALKVSAAAALATTAVGVPSGAVLGASLAILPLDLREHTMLGDSGANAFGASLGALAVRRRGRIARILMLGGVSGLTLASERVSFSKVIDNQPVLRTLDQLGRVKP